MSLDNRLFAYAKTKTQISLAVTAKLISAFVFATLIEQSLFFLNPKFQASSHLLWLHSPVCVGPGRKPLRPVFSERGSNHFYVQLNSELSMKFKLIISIEKVEMNVNFQFQLSKPVNYPANKRFNNCKF